VQPTGTTMKAVVLDGPGPPSALHIRQVPRPCPQRGWVLIKVRAFGLNQSELHMRLGLAGGVTFPRIPGSEAVGVVAGCPGGELSEGQQVATFGIGAVHHIDQIVQAHTAMEEGRVAGKIVVLT
jgi:NADPH:quinone reductase